MEDTVIKQEEGTVTETQEERTFTQAELDSIVKDRVWKERQKHSDYEELKQKAARFDEIENANKSELQKATERADALQKKIDDMLAAESIRNVRAKVSKQTNVPIELFYGSTEEECLAQANAILAFAKPNSYPSVKDGGETTVTHKRTEVELFEDWFNQTTK